MAETHSYEELKDMTVAQMREVATGVEHEALQGYTQLRKEELLHALCLAYGLEEHIHHEVVGINKSRVKGRIAVLKGQRDEALAAGDKVALKRARRKIHRLKRKIRRATI